MKNKKGIFTLLTRSDLIKIKGGSSGLPELCRLTLGVCVTRCTGIVISHAACPIGRVCCSNR